MRLALSRDGIISIKVRRFVTGPVLRLRLPFVVIDVCGVLLRYGIINGGYAPNNSKVKGSGPFRPILLDFPSTSEQNLQLIEAVEVFWLHNTPYGQAAGEQALETHREISAVSELVLSTNMASTSNRHFFSGVVARINEIDGLSQPPSKVQRESESLKVDTSPRYQCPRIDEYGRKLILNVGSPWVPRLVVLRIDFRNGVKERNRFRQAGIGIHGRIMTSLGPDGRLNFAPRS